MEDPSASTKDGKTKKEVSSIAHDEVKETSPTDVSHDIPAGSEHARWRTLHRVPPSVLETKKHPYEPVVLSLGPYHHGHTQFNQAEKLKDEVLDIICAAKDKGCLYNKIQERVDEIRHFYGGVSKDEYGDKVLAEMMLRDACFVVFIMESQLKSGIEKLIQIVRCLGMARLGLMFNDLYVMENQIPLWVIKLVIASTYVDKDKDEALIYGFLCATAGLGDHRSALPPWENREQPLHILDALRTTLAMERSIMKCPCFPFINIIIPRQKGISYESTSFFQQTDTPFGSVTDLKAKGIHFSPSSHRLSDIKFTSHWFYGKLQLPIFVVSNGNKAVLHNIIAFEMSPDSGRSTAVTAYANFMKSLIENCKDVKELREKGIIISTLATDEEVVKLFKEIDAYDFENIFQHVKMRLHEHCNNKAKTWVAELINTYFRSPWSAIALFAAAFLLCLTFLQTYYTINPGNN